MIMILFENHKISNLPTINADDIVIHANPDARPLNLSHDNEFYLEGYGNSLVGLNKISMHEIALSINKHNRVELL